MIFEHFALNVTDARAQAAWYVEHLGFRVLRQLGTAPFTTFLGDETGRVVVELYSNPAAPVLTFVDQPPLVFHFAVVSADAAADQARLTAAGASTVVVDALADGSQLVMMRDPWGVALQLCQRARPF